MKRSTSRGIALAAIVGMVLSVHAQDSNTQYPVITQQPLDQSVALGGTVTFSVTAANATSYQWMFNNAPLDGQTNSSISLPNATLASVGLYSAFVYNGSDAVPTRSANLNVYIVSQSSLLSSAASTVSSGVSSLVSGMAAPLLAPGGGGQYIVVFGLPIVSGGNSGNCPGKYSGYVSYLPPSGWGFLPASGTTTYNATDTNQTNTKVQYCGLYGDNNCAQTTVTVPYPAISSQYRFGIYFPINTPVPTNAYPITLVGFNP